MCASKAAFSPPATLLSATEDAGQPAVFRAILLIVHAFQEAIAMRRALHPRHFLGDE